MAVMWAISRLSEQADPTVLEDVVGSVAHGAKKKGPVRMVADRAPVGRADYW